MNYKVNNILDKKYIEYLASERQLTNEQDALDLVAACMEKDTNLILIHGEVLSEDFFKLGTGVAGSVIQKLVNYHIKTAAIIPHELANKGRFREMALETNKGSHFRIFNDRESAESWLVSTNSL